MTSPNQLIYKECSIQSELKLHSNSHCTIDTMRLMNLSHCIRKCSSTEYSVHSLIDYAPFEIGESTLSHIMTVST